MNLSRRIFLKKLNRYVAVYSLFPFLTHEKKTSNIKQLNETTDSKLAAMSEIFISERGTPEHNITKVIELMGGIERIIDKEDVVILKPNAQWWNQGTTNTNAIKGFIDLVLNIPGFSGEIIIAENHHYDPDNSRGWTTVYRNGDYNLNELVAHYRSRGINNVTGYHWRDRGHKSNSPQENKVRIVNNIADGDGYVWRKDLVYISPENRKCMMTYPIFTSEYSKRIIDLKEGVWGNNKFDKNLKLINFSCLNHHGGYAGVTASIKNLMGVVDLTCGYRGVSPEGYYNIHFLGRESFSYKTGRHLNYYMRRIGLNDRTIGDYLIENGSFNFYYAGGALGFWMKNIRKPDLNIIAGEWLGWGGRTDIKKRYQAKVVLASTDPVALDYYSAKYYLLPATARAGGGEHYRKLNDPDNLSGPFRKFLVECHNQGIGTLNENEMKISQYKQKNNE